MYWCRSPVALQCLPKHFASPLWKISGARAAPSKQLSQRTRVQGASWPGCLALIAAEQPGRRKILRIRRLERLLIARLQGGSCHIQRGIWYRLRHSCSWRSACLAMKHKAKWATCSPQPLFRPRTVFQFIFRKMPQIINYYKLKLCLVSSLIKL